MAEVLDREELESLVGDPAEVPRRVADWLDRIEALYREIEAWAAQAGWTVTQGAPIDMYERFLDGFALERRSQPVLVLAAPWGDRVWIRPYGLFVVGANGRIDIFAQGRSHVLVDLAAPFEPPQWRLYPRAGPERGRDFTPQLIETLLR